MGEQAPEESHTGTEIAENPEDPPQADDSPGYSSWLSIRYDVPPVRTHHFTHQFRDSTNSNNFLKGVKWSTDGSCFLTSSEDNIFRLFSSPDNGSYYQEDTCSLAVDTASDSYMASLSINEGESAYDFCWYPFMSASDPVTCVFASTSRDHPIHLWDATSGQLRCTYRAYDAMDEITAAFSIGFNPAGTKIYAGYNKFLRVFDIHRPGREFGQHSTTQGKKEGQSGVISAMAFSPSDNGMFATGCYNQTTAVYSEDNMELLYILHGQEGGVTHVQFSKDGNYLYTGGRKDPYILCWDLRKTVDVVYKLYRSTEDTNQRIQFDIDPLGQHLVTGGQDGLVHVYNLQTGQWVSSFQAANDTVNGFSFHPFLPMGVTSSGHRRFGVLEEYDSSDEVRLRGDENCASLWSFSYSLETSMETSAADQTSDKELQSNQNDNDSYQDP